MTCPICDQKRINCDCTETERRQYEEIQDLRLTDAEREAIANMIHLIETCHDECGRDAHHLRKLLERLPT